MSALAQRLKERYFRDDHPYQVLEREVEFCLRPEHALLDAGCGRTAPILAKFRNKARRLIGVDLVDFATAGEGLELHQCDLGAMPIEDGSIDVTMARGVMEHVTDPSRVYGGDTPDCQARRSLHFPYCEPVGLGLYLSEADSQPIPSLDRVQDRRAR